MVHLALGKRRTAHCKSWIRRLGDWGDSQDAITLVISGVFSTEGQFPVEGFYYLFFSCFWLFILRMPFVQKNFVVVGCWWVVPNKCACVSVWCLALPFEAIETFKIPVKYEDLSDGIEKFEMKDWPILDPHTVIMDLFNNGKMEIPMSEVRKYWRHHVAHGFHWATTVDSWDKIPLGIFGDCACEHHFWSSTCGRNLPECCTLAAIQCARVAVSAICNWRRTTLGPPYATNSLSKTCLEFELSLGRIASPLWSISPAFAPTPFKEGWATHYAWLFEILPDWSTWGLVVA